MYVVRTMPLRRFQPARFSLAPLRGKAPALTILLTLAMTLAGGCAAAQSPAAKHNTTFTAPSASAAESGVPLLLGPAEWLPAVRASCPVPLGWSAEPLKHDDKRDHQVWISPSGNTAYGVIAFGHFLLPLAPDEAVLNEVMKGMRDTEGDADLLARRKDAQLYGQGGIRFVAEGGRYLIRANLVTRGTRGWVIYAGTLRDQPTDAAELVKAEGARERTRLNPPAVAAGE